MAKSKATFRAGRESIDFRGASVVAQHEIILLQIRYAMSARVSTVTGSRNQVRAHADYVEGLLVLAATIDENKG